VLDCTYLTTVGNSSIVIVCIGPQAVEMPRLASKENMFVNMSLFGASEKKCIYIYMEILSGNKLPKASSQKQTKQQCT